MKKFTIIFILLCFISGCSLGTNKTISKKTGDSVQSSGDKKFNYQSENKDSDSDGLNDLEEINNYRTNPNSPDSDNDGYDDGLEIKNGFNPNEAAKYFTILSPSKENISIKQSRYKISGTNNLNVNKIRVKFFHKKSGLSDDYYLTKFKSGDTFWEYIADARYKNLSFGENEYTIMAYYDDKLLDQKSIIIDLTELPGKEQIISIDWEEKLIPAGKDENTEYYLLGKISSGDYKDQKLYLSAGGTMGGFEFDYYILNNEEKIYLKDNKIKIADLIDLPEKIQLPDTKYILEKGYQPYHLFSDYHVEKILFKHKTLGNIYLAYPEFLYERIKNGEEVANLYSCIVAELKDHTAQAYNIPINFFNEKSVINITFTDGEKNTLEYTNTQIAGCGSLCTPLAIISEKDLNPEKRLKIAGKTEDGENLYEFKNSKDGYLVNLYNDKSTLAYYDNGNLEKNKYSYDKFISMHPVLYWKDPAGRWIRFKNRSFDIMAEMCKPVIYLYPEKTVNIKVKVRPNGGFTYTNPPYNNGWDVTASPDSEIINNGTGEKFSYLFWEGIGLNYESFNEGFVVKKEELEKFFNEKLKILGMNDKEIDDFKIYWLERLSNSPYYLITFIPSSLFNEVAPLDIDPAPDNIIRIMMHAKELDSPIKVKEQKLSTPTREKFTVVEWGGAVIK